MLVRTDKWPTGFNCQGLVVLNEREMAAWVACHLARYPLLHRMMDEYVFFACAGFWSNNPPA
ncbi:hypothetical protein R3P88_004700 [Salmonella enterica]|uniref:Uncharacterized protein n=2 Tax=Salmonella enterica TaxID=28901 RepID=A0A5V3YV29_SALER|nr:hypothetical protein [Salmonella enterica]EBQ4756391.1 hypothetical protein [Salmonella enterica subsp. diarizonae]EDS4950899.1 hypothetical protein [Salmonella enterica subsp. enterica serovar Redlands]EDV1593218.1 hypothetical protein [Salmonella enterica subsp. salamae]EDW0435977.1 hypothetical protein [Salmonella enterica subsp. enterica serovar Lexington]EDW0631296.1 hypothetical protein [Salmonella enterica subsp. enterica serovar Anatum]EDX3148115.1 hypothetical protein [Salmonella 